MKLINGKVKTTLKKWNLILSTVRENWKRPTKKNPVFVER